MEENLLKAQTWLKQNTKRYAFKKLEKEIVKTEVCTECGSCVSFCPVNALTGDYSSGRYVPTLTGECISCGICYTLCPRTVVLSEDLIGEFKSAWRIRSKIENQTRQDGGAVTAVLAHMLDKRMIDGAIVTKQDPSKPWMPIPFLAKKRQDILASAGTVYTHSPIVPEMMKALRSGLHNLAVVGTSCHIDSIQKMEHHPAEFLAGASVFKIGLFCTESFGYKGLVAFFQKAGLDVKNIRHMAVSSGVFNVTTASGKQEWSVKEFGNVAAKSCSYCRDFTCKSADISCGNVGSDPGWTILLARTEKGEKVLQDALAKGTIEGERVEARSLEPIEKSARSKAMRYYSLKPGQTVEE
jgi:coenzyme F420 hydrogenase subunit beta